MTRGVSKNQNSDYDKAMSAKWVLMAALSEEKEQVGWIKILPSGLHTFIYFCNDSFF